jgi:hypothetical protein
VRIGSQAPGACGGSDAWVCGRPAQTIEPQFRDHIDLSQEQERFQLTINKVSSALATVEHRLTLPCARAPPSW